MDAHDCQFIFGSILWIIFSDPMSRYSPYSRYNNTITIMLLMTTKKIIWQRRQWQRLHQKLEVAAFRVGGKVAAKPIREVLLDRNSAAVIWCFRKLPQHFFAIANIRELWNIFVLIVMPQCLIATKRSAKKAQKGLKALGITWDSSIRSVEATMIEMTIWSKK